MDEREITLDEADRMGFADLTEGVDDAGDQAEPDDRQPDEGQ